MNRNPALLAVLLLSLIAGIVLLVQPGGDGKKEKAAPSESIFENLDTASVSLIRIAKEEHVDVMVRRPEMWVVATEDSFAADPGGVKGMLEELTALTTENVISRKAEKYEKFDLDSASAVRVDIEGDAGDIGTFYIGKTGADYSSTYFRSAARPEVFLRSAMIATKFDRSRSTWKDKQILKCEYNEMRRLEVIRGGERLLFETDEADEWQVIEPAGYQPMGSLVVAMARGLTNLTASGFPEEDEVDSMGFDPPLAEVKADLADGSRLEIQVGTEREDRPGHFVKRVRDGAIYVVMSSRVNNYIRPAEELIELIPDEPVGDSGDAQEDEGGQ